MVAAEQVVHEYKQKGFDALVITNHFEKNQLSQFGDTDQERMDRYLLAYHLAKAEGEKCGIRVFLGMELRVISGFEDYLLFGVTPEFIYENPRLYTLSLSEVHEICRKAGVLLIQAHPFRSPCQPQNPQDLDGAEIYNDHPGHKNHNELAEEWAQQNPHFIRTSGSDYHELTHPSGGGIVTDEDVKDGTQLVQVLRDQSRFTLLKHGI